MVSSHPLGQPAAFQHFESLDQHLVAQVHLVHMAANDVSQAVVAPGGRCHCADQIRSIMIGVSPALLAVTQRSIKS
jgi:hypothetical protein